MSVEEHYAKLLAPVYSWLAGGIEHACGLGWADLQTLVPRDGSFAVDLGAGFGMHTLPLSRRGWRVIAIDSSPHLLDELIRVTRGLDVTVHRGDLLAFTDCLTKSDRPDLILCMGDTLTHLASTEQVAQLARRVAERLSPHGRFVATLRDYTRLPTGTARFIPVRADAERILTCFLEDCGEQVAVHDILYERAGDGWKTTVGSYPKLRLTSAALIDIFSAAGLHAEVEQGPRGMLRLVADAGPAQHASVSGAAAKQHPDCASTSESADDIALSLHRIDPQPSGSVLGLCEQLEIAQQTVQATLDLYRRRGFVPPWVGYLAEENGCIVGSCGFAGPPVEGEAEIAYFTFPGNEGRGIASRMAAALMRGTRRTSVDEVFIAHTLPEEGASPTILKRLGFECLGVVNHPEDGAVWKWRERRTG